MASIFKKLEEEVTQQLQGGRELNYVSQKDAYSGNLFQKLITAVNTLAKNAGVSAVGKVSAPPRIDGINVQGTLAGDTITAPSEVLHWTLTHNQEIQKGIRYFSEIDKDPNFPTPHVIDHGTSRSAFLHLPALDNDGVQHTYYMRSYAQYHGSDPSHPTVLGNLGGALKIQLTGTSKTSLLTSAGSGTAAPNGQQGGHGLGKVQTRPAPGPKRNTL
jgi:hypothetical protein